LNERTFSLSKDREADKAKAEKKKEEKWPNVSLCDLAEAGRKRLMVTLSVVDHDSSKILRSNSDSKGLPFIKPVSLFEVIRSNLSS
jgi:hypothetical protein